jgi:hypothetical protein
MSTRIVLTVTRVYLLGPEENAFAKVHVKAEDSADVGTTRKAPSKGSSTAN